jgi:hypothetical protein
MANILLLISKKSEKISYKRETNTNLSYYIWEYQSISSGIKSFTRSWQHIKMIF